MVNPIKHMKINRNPFVKYLKEFEKEHLPIFKEVIPTDFKGHFRKDLEDGRYVIIEHNSLFLVNPIYSSTGVFRIDFEDLPYNDGTLYFRPDENEKDLHYDLAMSYTSKNMLYELINEIDSINDRTKVKELFMTFEKVPVMLGRARPY